LNSPAAEPTAGKLNALRLYAHPRVVTMLFLGFSCGLPFLLVSSTLSFWLKDARVAIASIGFFAAVRNVYSLKFAWAPLVNQAPLPWLTRLVGQRRSWMLLGQVVVVCGLLYMSTIKVDANLKLLAVAAVIAAFGSATQDCAVDAYRIEAAGAELQPAMLATYTLGYRLAILVTSWGALQLADGLGWPGVYQLMALLGLVGIITALAIREPAHPAAADSSARPLSGRVGRWLADAVIEPFHEFFTRQPVGEALWLLLFISIYRLSDFSIGNMASTLYKDLGFSNAEIGNVVKFVGFFATIAGAVVAGWLTQRWPAGRSLLLGGVLMASTNAAFALLATTHHDLLALGLVVSAENFAQGFGGVVFVAFLSALTNRRYTATQYALFSSLTGLIGHTLASFAGEVVASYGYVAFFAGAGVLGIPAILMSLRLARKPAAPIQDAA
jgi:PAT family beta-lactamase induction signal transducer AmpG